MYLFCTVFAFQISTAAPVSSATALDPDSQPPLLKRFKLLTQDTMNKTAAARGITTGVDTELDWYMQDVTDVDSDHSLLFWQEREHS